MPLINPTFYVKLLKIIFTMKKILNYSYFLVLGSIILTTSISCSDDDNGGTEPDEPVETTLIEAANGAGLTTLVSAIEAVEGLSTSLTGQTAITVFAPTNAAFTSALGAYGVDDLNQLIAELGGVDNLEAV